MPGFTLSTTSARPFEQSVTLARGALAEAGFGVLTKVDLRARLAAVNKALSRSGFAIVATGLQHRQRA